MAKGLAQHYEEESMTSDAQQGGATHKKKKTSRHSPTGVAQLEMLITNAPSESIRSSVKIREHQNKNTKILK